MRFTDLEETFGGEHRKKYISEVELGQRETMQGSFSCLLGLEESQGFRQSWGLKWHLKRWGTAWGNQGVVTCTRPTAWQAIWGLECDCRKGPF